MSLTKTLLSFKHRCLAYDVKHFKDGKIESIRIPKNRLEKLKELGVECCFNDNTPIFMPCDICKNASKLPCHAFRTVRGLVYHIISQHKESALSIPLSIILETLSAVEIEFLQKQNVNMEKL